jgi:predicted nucleotidyltransferase
MNARLLTTNVQEIVAEFPAISLIYLFGSQVDGKLGPMSDYDFAILMDHGTTNGKMQAQLTHLLGGQVGVPRVDVVLLNQATIALTHAVIAQGQLVYQRDVATRVEYEAQVMSLYGDYLPVLRAQRAELLKRENHDARIQRYRAAFGRTERTLSQIVSTPE